MYSFTFGLKSCCKQKKIEEAITNPHYADDETQKLERRYEVTFKRKYVYGYIHICIACMYIISNYYK